jgi:hypothetical protein
MKNKVWKQTELKAPPATAAERQAKRKGKLLKDSEELWTMKRDIKRSIFQAKERIKMWEKTNENEVNKARGALDELICLGLKFNIEIE